MLDDIEERGAGPSFRAGCVTHHEQTQTTHTAAARVSNLRLLVSRSIFQSKDSKMSLFSRGIADLPRVMPLFDVFAGQKKSRTARYQTYGGGYELTF